MSKKTGEKNEDKVHQVDLVTESVIDRMLGANDNSSDAPKRKDYLLDLETLLTRKLKEAHGYHVCRPRWFD